MKISITDFKGMMPIVASSRLGLGYLTNAVDCDFQKSTVTPFRTNLFVKTPISGIGSMFETACCLIEGTRCETYAEGLPGCKPMVFRAGDGPPRMALETEACAGTWYRLGFPCLDAPSLSTTAAKSNLSAGPLSVVYTLVSNYTGIGGEYFESQPSLPSNIVEADESSTLFVSGLPACDPQYNIKEIRVYVSRTGFDDANNPRNTFNSGYFLKTTVPCGQTSVSFNYGGAGDALTTIDYAHWPDNVTDINSWRGGQLTALNGNQVVFSIKNNPLALDESSRMAFYGKALRYIVGVDHGYVLTDGAPFVIKLQNNSEGVQCHAGQHLPEALPMVSKRSAAMWGDTVIYATKRGLQTITGVQPKELTFWSEQQWQEMRPDTLIGAVHDGHYFGFTQTHGFRVSLQGEPNLTMLGETEIKAIHNGKFGRLYLATETEIVRWNEGLDHDTAIARRDDMPTPRVALSAVRVVGSANQITILPGCGNAKISLGKMDSCKNRRFTTLRTNYWGYIIETKDEIQSLDLATGLGEL